MTSYNNHKHYILAFFFVQVALTHVSLNNTSFNFASFGTLSGIFLSGSLASLRILCLIFIWVLAFNSYDDMIIC